MIQQMAQCFKCNSFFANDYDGPPARQIMGLCPRCRKTFQGPTDEEWAAIRASLTGKDTPSD
jgi:hypothetical protein